MAFNLREYNKIQNIINLMSLEESRIMGGSITDLLKDLRISSYNLPKLLTEANGFYMQGDMTQRLLQAYEYQKNIKRNNY